MIRLGGTETGEVVRVDAEPVGEGEDYEIVRLSSLAVAELAQVLDGQHPLPGLSVDAVDDLAEGVGLAGRGPDLFE